MELEGGCLVGNFRVEPPGLFIGRGEHPKIGKVKRRIHPSDVSINIGKYAPIPECPIPGERYNCSKTSWRTSLERNLIQRIESHCYLLKLLICMPLAAGRK
ncbi:putative DNA topoisomerase [Medicago truncatula]|uniref:Putative DNA topoisomerase n=1 Tax=Medicago truncatula TaxID=3880 RepID=A0A396IZG5_MEDTR|nr:putative DNA topoisomerase [Medicago truncatula]